MDAKKKALTVKKLNFSDSTFFKYKGTIFVGFMVYNFLAYYLMHLYNSKYPDRRCLKNPVSEYFEAHDYNFREAVFLGILPNTFENTKLDVRKLQESLPRGSAQEV